MERENPIADHWGQGDVVALILSAVKDAGKSPDALTVENLAAVDHFHVEKTRNAARYIEEDRTHPVQLLCRKPF